MSAYSNVIDVGEIFGLKQQRYASLSGAFVQHSINDPLVVGSGSVGFNASDLRKKFPNTMKLLTGGTAGGYLNWTDEECLQRTYPWFAIMEAGLMFDGGIDGTGFQNRTPLYIPPGVWYVNSEIRVGQQRIMGGGQSWNYGSGGTNIRLRSQNWKSLYGAQNDGIRIAMVPFTYAGEAGTSTGKLSPYGNHEYAHFLKVENMRFDGTATLNGFWDTEEPLETGVLWHNPGEGSGPRSCGFSNFRGFGYMVSGTIAPFTAFDNDIFYNWIGGIGVRGGAHAKMTFNNISGDNNPWMLFVFKSGSDALRIGKPFLPSHHNGNPGGNITFNNCKLEAFTCRTGYEDFSACTPNALAGRGGMWARLTGRFQFMADGCTLNVHGGKIWTAIEVFSDITMNALYPGQGFGTIPLNNSRIEIRNTQMWGVENFIAEWTKQRVVPTEAAFDDQLSSTVTWSNLHDGGATFRPSATGAVVLPTEPALWRGTQPIINQNQTGQDWDASAAPDFNYNVITGEEF